MSPLVENDNSYLEINKDDSCTIAMHDDISGDERAQLFEAARDLGYAEVVSECYDPESGFHFMEVIK